MIEIENVDKKEKMKRIVIHHHDPDGLTSASLIPHALGFGNTWIFISQDPNEEFPVLQADEVYIVDVAITEKTWGSIGNIQCAHIVWIDHHRPFTELSSLAVPQNVKILLDPTSPSAVLLVQKYFSLNDEISRKIVELGTKADTWQLDPFVESWMALDMAYSIKKRDKTHLIKALATGKLEITGHLKRTLNSYLHKKEEAKEKLLKNTVIQDIHGHLVAIGLAPSFISGSEGAEIISQKTNSEVQIVLKYQGWMSFRRAKNSNINLLTLANIFGGGGHEYASGATFSKHVTSRNFQRIAEEIFSKIAEVL